MKAYTQEMRAKQEPCPYCGFWHSSLSHPDQFFGYVLEIQRLEEQLKHFRDFARDLLDDWDFLGDVNGDDLQDLAVKHGLLAPEVRDTPCGSEENGIYCTCAEYYGESEAVTCYRYTPLLKEEG